MKRPKCANGEEKRWKGKWEPQKLWPPTDFEALKETWVCEKDLERMNEWLLRRQKLPNIENVQNAPNVQTGKRRDGRKRRWKPTEMRNGDPIFVGWGWWELGTGT